MISINFVLGVAEKNVEIFRHVSNSDVSRYPFWLIFLDIPSLAVFNGT